MTIGAAPCDFSVYSTSPKEQILDAGAQVCYNSSGLWKTPHSSCGLARVAFLQPTMLTSDVSRLLKASLGSSLTLEIDTGPRVLEDLEVDFLRGTVQVVRAEGGLFVQGTVESQLGLECVRCLDPFAFPVTLQLAEMFRMTDSDPRPGAIYAVSEDGELDLAPLVRELAWLAIPMKHLCDHKCKGLCPHCGVNLNDESCECEEMRVDPRLAPLKELL